MRFSAKFKYVWWSFLLVVVMIILYFRRDALLIVNLASADTVLLATAAALLLLPFFSEITVLGFTLKQQVEEAKKELKQEIKDQVYSLRADFQNYVGVNNQQHSHVYLGTPPPADSQLSELEQQLRPGINAAQQRFGVVDARQNLESLIPQQNTLLAFASRYQVENEIRRIWESRFPQITSDIGISSKIRPMPFSRMVEDLIKTQIIPPNIGHSIREVYAVGSPAVHGEEPSPEKIAFLEDVVPPLVEVLRAIK